MKKIAFLLVCFFAFFTSVVSGYDGPEFNTAAASESSASESVIGNVDEYQLPYPGILPDNPLYPVKALRDRLVNFLISDPLKKAEFNILQADKRLQAGVYLIDRSKKHDLAIDTISKGENYFADAIIKTLDSQKQGLPAGGILDKLKKSAVKHKKTITEIIKKAPADKKSDYQILLKRIEKNQSEVNKIKL